MKGKVGLVLGVALGYVLGARAGRARYEQIKRGATAVWETPLVQQGVTAVKSSVGDGLDNVKAAAGRAAKSAFDSAMQARTTKPSTSEANPSGASAGEARGDASEGTTA